MNQRLVVYTVLLLIVASWVPLAVIAKSRYAKSPHPRWHVFYDMDNQPKYKPQKFSPLFPDGRTSRPPVPGTVARGELHDDTEYWYGRDENDAFIDHLPRQVRLDAALLARGRERYGIYCAPCHGLTGEGDGMVARRAEALAEGTWTIPLSYDDQTVRSRPLGHIFETISHGIRNMPAYGSQIPVEDRWAIVAWVKTLQRSLRTSVDDVPPEARAQLSP